MSSHDTMSETLDDQDTDFPFFTEQDGREFGLAQCSSLMTLVGPAHVKEGGSDEFMLVTSGGPNTSTILANFVLKKNEEIRDERVLQERFSPYFSESGIWTLEVTPMSNDLPCQGMLQMDIHVYHESIVYLGPTIAGIDDEELASVFRTKSVLFQKTDTTARLNTDTLSAAWSDLARADMIIFGHVDVLELFSEMEKIQKVKSIDFSNKRMYIVSTQSRSFLSKVLASPLAELGATHISLISEEQFHTLLTRWSL